MYFTCYSRIVFKHLYSTSRGEPFRSAASVQGPMRKKLVLRKAKEDEGLRERRAERTEGESAFQRAGPIETRDLG